MTHERSIDIRVSPDIAAAFVGDAANLPRWTHFFQKCEGATADGRLAFSTPIGRSETAIVKEREGEGYRLRIVSSFGERVEHSDIAVDREQDGCHVRFSLHLPDAAPPEVVTRMVRTLEEELVTLKGLLEAQRG
jgi:hypothetical protein